MTYKSIRSLRYRWHVYRRRLSFLGSFPQTSAHTGPGGAAKPQLDTCAHTHACRWGKTRKGVCLYATKPLEMCATNPVNFSIMGFISIDISWLHNLLWKRTATYPTWWKSMIPWAHFTNPLHFTLLTTVTPHCWKKKKNKSTPRSVSMYAWQQLPRATKAKNNLILERGLQKNHSQETFTVPLNEPLLSCWQLILMKCGSSNLHNDPFTTKLITMMQSINHS